MCHHYGFSELDLKERIADELLEEDEDEEALHTDGTSLEEPAPEDTPSHFSEERDVEIDIVTGVARDE